MDLYDAQNANNLAYFHRQASSFSFAPQARWKDRQLDGHSLDQAPSVMVAHHSSQTRAYVFTFPYQLFVSVREQPPHFRILCLEINEAIEVNDTWTTVSRTNVRSDRQTSPLTTHLQEILAGLREKRVAPEAYLTPHSFELLGDAMENGLGQQ